MMGTGLLVLIGFAILVTLVYALGVRAIALLYPRSDPRRVELIAERYKIPRKDRLFWVFEQFETAWLDGREARAEARFAHLAGAFDTDPGLIEAATLGDARAIEQLIAQVRPFIVRYCRARIASGFRSQADVVAQEVCLAVLTSLPTFRSTGPSSFLLFVYGIAMHKVVDFHRAQSAA